MEGWMGEESCFWSSRESEPGWERRESSKEYEQEEEEGLNMWSTLVVSVHPGGVAPPWWCRSTLAVSGCAFTVGVHSGVCVFTLVMSVRAFTQLCLSVCSVCSTGPCFQSADVGLNVCVSLCVQSADVSPCSVCAFSLLISVCMFCLLMLVCVSCLSLSVC